MKVSVIIPTYKGSSELRRAVISVKKQVRKDFDVEIIVVDDNSPDSAERFRTENVMEEFQDAVYLKHEKNLNGASARNTGIKYASGDYITFLDDDDFMLRNRLLNAVGFLKKNSVFHGVYCNVILLNEDLTYTRTEIKQELFLRDMLLNDMSIGTGSNIFLKRECFDSILFDPSFIRNQDVDFMIGILSRYRIGGISDYDLVKSHNGTNNQIDYFRMKQVKSQLFLKHKNLINGLGCEFEKQYKCSAAAELFNIAKGYGYKALKDSSRELKKFRKLTFRERLHLFLSASGLKNTGLCKSLLNITGNKKRCPLNQDSEIYNLYKI